jgi:hypothetical protein
MASGDISFASSEQLESHDVDSKLDGVVLVASTPRRPTRSIADILTGHAVDNHDVA